MDEPDTHLTNLGSKGLGEPPIIPTAAAIANAIRDATGADVRSLPISREEMLRALREASERRSRLELLRPDSLEGAKGGPRVNGSGSAALAGGTELVPLLRDRIVDATTLVDVRAVVPKGIDGTTIGAGTTLGELEANAEVPHALREACRLAASPQLRAMGTIGGNLLQATRCWYWRLKYPCWLHGGDQLLRPRGSPPRARGLRERALRVRRTRRIPPPPCSRLDATLRTDRRELPLADLYRLPTDDDREMTTLEPGELILELDVPAPEASTYLKAMDRRLFSFALVGVATARSSGGTRIALSGMAPIPWLLDGEQALDTATPLPQNAYKLEIARALVRRALDEVAA